jgi:hypothetical protein
MSETSSSSNQISIAYYVKAVNDKYGKNQNISHSLYETGLELAELMQSILMTKENLKTAAEESPRSTTLVGVDRNAGIICPEILAWAIAILAAAWTEWVFTAKSNPSSKYQTDPEYTNDKPRQAAATNAKLVVPYIRSSIMDALGRAIQIGNSKGTNYEPDQAIDSANIILRKDCECVYDNLL